MISFVGVQSDLHHVRRYLSLYDGPSTHNMLDILRKHVLEIKETVCAFRASSGYKQMDLDLDIAEWEQLSHSVNECIVLLEHHLSKLTAGD